MMPPHGSHRAARAGAAAARSCRDGAGVRAGLPAPPDRGRRRRRARAPRRCSARRSAPSSWPRARGGAPVAVRAFNPSRPSTATSAAASVLETNTDDLPFLVDSVSAELAGARPGDRAASSTRSSAPSATRRRRIARIQHPARRAGAPSRSCTSSSTGALAPEELADLEDAVRTVLDDVRHVVRDFPASCGERVERDGRDRPRRGRAATTPTRSPRPSRSCAGSRDDNFIFLGARDYELADGALRVVDGSASACSTTSALGMRRAGPRRDAGPDLRERALEGDLLLVSKTNRCRRCTAACAMDYVGIAPRLGRRRRSSARRG